MLEDVDGVSYDTLIVVDNVGDKMSTLVCLSDLEKDILRMKLLEIPQSIVSFFYENVLAFSLRPKYHGSRL